MQIADTDIADVKIIRPTLFNDERGFFMETFEKNRYRKMLGIDLDFVQDNYSRSYKNVLRGLHFQTENPQGKLVRCVRGEIFDVVVDIRPHSPTFGRWTSIVLNDDNQIQCWIPPGFAHGFAVLSDVADVEYKCTDFYNPKAEGCLIWNDPAVGIDWPVSHPLLSAKDQQGKTLEELYK
ncbi:MULTISPECIES: dTDP-4-dehydrorhamnose 3,5-epimerase [unclassified Neisseria]|uniref:dTDP-4-dehydrorhamnose 3,5-epimerase n=1 Tax=unclassified Neisseria TaxID=2623750 RepID=UPI002666F24C|nr:MULTISPECIES: dTDP-4-dehydrorhamnose 3,5-epimerase [unclassified Neisseria]MDO1510517.1 dTDP-4-dehydrorhamnose 3,5-epimerase [Neisseria sp. MVDL19-042950]MDO1516310.1 dTDP-4-dehydrorhamnose 3,5-epimerase [Neisseria sp. MVDL18-041461]MDO1564144.1 dTDP-4-dehydrorhamnose 3,5-epimerase [Neisseria sp. MVDL20-010259]